MLVLSVLKGCPNLGPPLSYPSVLFVETICELSMVRLKGSFGCKTFGNLWLDKGKGKRGEWWSTVGYTIHYKHYYGNKLFE